MAKMTNREFYTGVINSEVSAELKEFATEAIAKLDERNRNRQNTMTKTQKENVAVKENILAVTEVGVQYTAAATGELAGISTSKASSMLRQLAADGYFTVGEVKVTGKGKVKGYTRVEVAADSEAETETEN